VQRSRPGPVQPPSLYQAALGAGFGLLPRPLQDFHSLSGTHRLAGWVEVGRPGSLAARCVAWCLRAPRAAKSGALRFELHARPGSEVWIRHFPGTTMTSRLTAAPGGVAEHFGPVRLLFALRAGAEELQMQLAGVRVLGLPCPRWLLPRIVARETASDGRLHFHVQAALPLAGLVASYRGYLDVPAQGSR
jgi:hypothetical protein